MEKLTSRERFKRMFEHRLADRIPVIDLPWTATVERWQREGMPKDVSYVDFFGLDKVVGIVIDNSPRYEVRTTEETDDYIVTTTPWGVTMKNRKHEASTPQFLGFTITDPDKWQEAKKRMVPAADRIDWKRLKENYKKWRQNGYWIEGEASFGFDLTHSWVVGTERTLMALVENPEWCVDMFQTELEVGLKLLDMVWDAGYTFDCLAWCDDMGYKHNQFFSLKTYRELVKPFHRKAIEWAHAKGIKTRLHSCGDVNPFVPELVEIGLDGLNPIEVKAGMDPVALKKKYGGKLLLHGGINAVLWSDLEAMEAEIKKVVPVVKESGGYIFSSDHSVPSNVSLESFQRIVKLAKKLGRYD